MALPTISDLDAAILEVVTAVGSLIAERANPVDLTENIARLKTLAATINEALVPPPVVDPAPVAPPAA